MLKELVKYSTAWFDQHWRIRKALLTGDFFWMPLTFITPYAGDTQHWFQEFRKQKLIKEDYL